MLNWPLLAEWRPYTRGPAMHCNTGVTIARFFFIARIARSSYITSNYCCARCIVANSLLSTLIPSILPKSPAEASVASDWTRVSDLESSKGARAVHSLWHPGHPHRPYSARDGGSDSSGGGPGHPLRLLQDAERARGAGAGAGGDRAPVCREGASGRSLQPHAGRGCACSRACAGVSCLHQGKVASSSGEPPRQSTCMYA